MNDGVRMPELYHFLLDHTDDYQALIFGPYPFWLAFACSQISPERSILLTCLHDEPYAYLELFQPVFTGIAGLLMMTEPEHELAHRVCEQLAPHAVVGCGVGTDLAGGRDPDGFRQRHGIDGPFVLYLGRREGAKGWPELVEAFISTVRRLDLPLTLVTAGGGEVVVPADARGKIIDVGFLSDEERDNALAAASALVQPSRYEAFSRSIMEAWLAGTLVIANGASDVLAYHCRRSGAGLTYDDDFELEECLSFVAGAPEAAAAMAAPGRAYVLEHYTWGPVLDDIEEALDCWTGPGSLGAEPNESRP